jgi:NAD(P)-dependent dehydrogenase (short-subunit alcohol dehydrogenase family)
VKRLQDKVAVVTGASKGIGKAISLAFADEGARVVAVSRSKESLKDLESKFNEGGYELTCVLADLSNEADIARIPAEVLEKFGRIDILVNNAGIIHPSMELVDFDVNVWKQVIEVNLTAPAFLTKAVLPGMMKNKSGKIINISSIGGRKGGKGRSAYRASKAGLINLTETMAAEARPYGIDVNCVCPSATDTEGYRENIDPNGRDLNPKVMVPEQIAEVVVFLASDASSAVTGSAIDAFGGTNPVFS